MKEVPIERAPRRRGPQPNPMLFVMVVPLAASCMLGLPLGSQARQMARQDVRPEQNVIVEQRERRVAEAALAEAWPQDPPRHVSPWKAQPDSAEVVAQAWFAQQARFARNAAAPGDRQSFDLPKFYYLAGIAQRGPPVEVTYG